MLPITVMIIVLFVVLTVSITVYGYKHMVKPGTIFDQLERSTNVENVRVNAFAGLEQLERPSALYRILASVGNILPPSPAEARMMTKEFVAAGIRRAGMPEVFTGAKLVCCAALGILMLFERNQITNDPLRRILIPVAGAIAGYLAPGFFLRMRIKRRHKQIKRALPDVLDMLVISTEAGCALDKAILGVSKEFRTFHPEISEELAMVNAEMLAGLSRTDALRHFADRTGEEELRKLVAILVQTDRFGTSIADALRSQSDFMRKQRKQIAEEKAGKVGVKLVFPIFFFCMPALMVLVAGPGLISLFTNLLPSLNSVQ